LEIFRLFGSVFLKSDEADKGLDSIDKKAEGVGGKLGSMIGTAAKVGVGVAVGVAGAATAMFGLAQKTSDAASRISDMSQKLGMTNESFQEWDFILAQSGTSVDSMQAGMKKLTNQFDDLGNGGKTATDAFGALGLTYEDLQGKTQEEIFSTTITALQGIEDTTKRAAIANDLLGKSGSELAPLLNAGAGAVDDLKTKAHELGIIMSDDAVNSGEEFGDTMDQLKATLGGLFNQALAPLLPVINDLAQKFIQLLPPLMSIIQPLIEKLVPVISRLAEALLPPFMRILEALMPVLDPLIDLFLMLVDTALMPLIDLFAQLIEVLLPPMTELLIALMPVIKPILEIFGELAKIVLPLLVEVIQFIVDTIVPLLTTAFEKLGPVLDNLSEKFKTIFDGIKGIVKGAVNFLIDGVNLLIRGLNKIHFSLPDWIPGVGGKSFGINIGEIPKLNIGTNYVPNDMIAMLHKGEAVVPKAYNPSAGGQAQIVFERGAFDGAYMMDDYGVDKVMDRIITRLRGMGLSPG